MAKSNAEIIHSVEDQATVFAEGLLQTKVNAKVLERVRKTLTSLDQELFNIRSETLGAKLDFADAILKVDQRCTNTFDSLEQYVDDLGIAVATLALERLPLQLFAPKKLLSVLESIEKQMPRRWALAIDSRPENLWLFYKEAVVKTAVFTNPRRRQSLKLFLHIPIYEVKFEFTLYQVTNLPVYSENTTHGVQYRDLSDYLAASNDQELFTPLQKDEVESCVKTTGLWICSIPRIFNKIHTTQSCVMALFAKDENQNQYCTQMLVVWKGPYNGYVGNRKWLISDREDRDVSFTCADVNNQGFSVMRIPKLTTLVIPLGCSAQTKNWMIPVSSKTTTAPAPMEISFANDSLFRLVPNSLLNPSKVSFERHKAPTTSDGHRRAAVGTKTSSKTTCRRSFSERCIHV